VGAVPILLAYHSRLSLEDLSAEWNWLLPVGEQPHIDSRVLVSAGANDGGPTVYVHRVCYI